MVKIGKRACKSINSLAQSRIAFSTVPGQKPDALSGLEQSWSKVMRQKIED
jgi:hypothetical protein